MHSPGTEVISYIEVRRNLLQELCTVPELRNTKSAVSDKRAIGFKVLETVMPARISVLRYRPNMASVGNNGHACLLKVRST